MKLAAIAIASLVACSQATVLGRKGGKNFSGSSSDLVVGGDGATPDGTIPTYAPNGTEGDHDSSIVAAVGEKF